MGLVVGFAAVALWQLVQAIWGFGYVTDRTKNVRQRASNAINVVIFVGLAVLAGTAAAGGGCGGGGKASATVGVFGLAGRRFIVGAVGIAILAVGIVKIVRGWQQKLTADQDLPSDRSARQLPLRLHQVGSIAEGASIGSIGVLVVITAIRFRPDEASGLNAALKAPPVQPRGVFLLIVVALGLAVYGVFCFVDVRYHRV